MPADREKKTLLPTPEQALPGRDTPIPTASHHAVNGHSLHPPWPDGMQRARFGMGCFWGAERLFWRLDGVYVTAVGYSGGVTPNPTYEEVCSGLTGHAEVVRVIYDPALIGYDDLLRIFWESHDPTQGMRQGNDVGTQYRSCIHCFNVDQHRAALASRDRYAQALAARGLGPITTEIVPAAPFYYAEEWHQQYLAKNPGGYCGIAGTGVVYPVSG